MKTHDFLQGSPDWLAHRRTTYNASDAPAMMGVSQYKTRAQLIKEAATGLAADVDAGTQRLLDAGHRFEALARPHAEVIVGDELATLCGSIDAGLSRPLAASFDGLTFMNDVAFEHKTLNNKIRDCIVDEACGNLLPAQYRVQMEQQLLVSGAGKCLFMATKWAGDELTEQRWTWYYPDLDLRAQIVAGWAQFERDVAAYAPAAAAEPAPVGKAPETLPALRIEVTGAVTASNLAEFKQTALEAIRSVNRDLKTDADFADADKAVKWCADVESRLKAAKEHALSQTADIDALFKTLDDIGAEARSVRLDLDKVIARRKVEVKEQAVTAARRALDEHIAELNAELAPMRLLPVAADFPAAIKGLRSIASMQDALDTTLAAGKTAADAQARAIRANAATFKAQAEGFAFLFADLGQIIHKPADDFGVLVQSRLAAHKVAEEKRLEAERERIRAEESARLQREQAEAAAKAQREAEAAQRAEVAQRLADEQAKRAMAQASQPEAKQTPPAPVLHGMAAIVHAQMEPVERPTLKLGEIQSRLGFDVSADFLASLGFLHTQEKASKLYRESQFKAICAGISAHVLAVAHEHLQAA